MLNRPFLFAASLVISSGIMACGGAQPTAKAPEAAEEAPPALPPPLPKGHVWRYQVMQVMSPGLGAFLQRVDVKEKMVGGQFHGFQLLALQGEPSFWEGVDLRVGDIVTSVNGQPIGHYDEAFRVWQSLPTASEIDVAYERAGEQRILHFTVHEDDESPVIESPKGQPTTSDPVAPTEKENVDTVKP